MGRGDQTCLKERVREQILESAPRASLPAMICFLQLKTAQHKHMMRERERTEPGILGGGTTGINSGEVKGEESGERDDDGESWGDKRGKLTHSLPLGSE